MKNKKWFSLIEIIVATSILSICIFWVYRLIAENGKLIQNSWNYLQGEILIGNIKECIDFFWFDIFKWSSQKDYSFIVNPNCSTGLYDTWYTFPSFQINEKNYFLFWNITNSWADFIEWNLWAYQESTGKIQKTYVQTK